MSKFTSGITFLYYNDFDKAKYFFEELLGLELVMNQGFATVYKISDKSFIGAVKKEKGSIDSSNKGGTLISLCTKDVAAEYKRFIDYDLPYISKLEVIEEIPLKSFFFKDFEGYDFEIQEFLNNDDKEFF